MRSFLDIAEKLLSVSDSSIKALKEVQSGFTGLPLFPLIPFGHDTLHATLQCSKRCHGRFLEACWICGPIFQKDCKERLDRKYVPVGKERNQDGSPKEGDNPDQMNQYRGLQEIAAVAARAWESFSKVNVGLLSGMQWVRALAPAFEYVIGNMFFISRALYLGTARAQIFFLGEKSQENRRLVVDAVQEAWIWIRRVLCHLYPGTCTAGAGYWLLAWMMRSCHTVEHCIG